jgi:predicted PurR-regulated permease PerM
MDQSNSAKMAPTKAPQSLEMEALDTTNSVLSPLERHLGLIKTMAIIMAVLIVAALVVIFVTIYGRVTAENIAKNIQENELVIPVDSHVISANLAEKGQMLLVIEDKTGQQLWQIDQAGKIQRKIRVIQSP